MSRPSTSPGSSLPGSSRFSWCGGVAGKEEEVNRVPGVPVELLLREIRPRREPWLGEAAGGAKKQGRQATRTGSSGMSWCGGAAGKKEEVSRIPCLPVELLLREIWPRKEPCTTSWCRTSAQPRRIWASQAGGTLLELLCIRP